LLKQTPKDHPDHGILLEVQVVTQEFLGKVGGGDQRDGPVSLYLIYLILIIAF